MKNERGSVSLFVLISMLFFLIIVVTAYVSVSNKLQGQNEEIAQIKASYEQDLSDEALLQLYNRVTRTREWLSGSGTLEDTYKIYKIEDLVEFSIISNDGNTFEGKYVELMNDLDFKRDSSYENANRTDFGDVNGDGTVQDLKTELTTGKGFPCIAATEANAFNGTFMGNEHEIRNLWIRNSNETVVTVGLFGWIGNSSIDDLGITGEVTTGVTANIGALTGNIKNNNIANISNCYNKATVSSLVGQYSIGGLIGSTENGILNATNCHNEGSISGSNNAGGIAGNTLNSINIQNCYNIGTITNNLGSRAGGLVGRNWRDTQSIIIKNSYNAGNITGTLSTGGLVGYNVRYNYN